MSYPQKTAKCHNPEAIMVAAYMDRRQGNFEKAIQQFSEVITVDPLNPTIELANTLVMTRQFSAAEHQYNRGISLSPDHLILNVLKAYLINFMKTGESTAFRTELALLPASMAEDPDVLNWWLVCALNDRDWQRSTELVEKMKGGEDDGYRFRPVVTRFSLLGLGENNLARIPPSLRLGND